MKKQELYNEALRPQFHFTAKRNWLNDPNGMVCHNGGYHLCFQHNPKGLDWDNMTWGHAVSSDMVHWQQVKHAIHPDEHGMIYSGSSVVDHANTAGFQNGSDPAIVACFTYRNGPVGTQALAYSNNGRTFHKFEGNPVLENQSGGVDRDPKIFWHEKTKHWIMVLLLERDQCFGMFRSKNLKQWEPLGRHAGFFECPDFFELPIDGNAHRKRWVLHDVHSSYQVGKFDGEVFTPDDPDKQRFNVGRNFYAAQSFSNMPDHRRVQMAWMSGGSYPGMPFNQQMTFPCEVTLRSTSQGVRVCTWPIQEIEQLYANTKTITNLAIQDGSHNPLASFKGDLWDIEARIKTGTAKEIGFVIRGQVYSYNTRTQSMYLSKRVTMPREQGRIKLRFLVDRASIEMFGNDGLVSAADMWIFPSDDNGLSVYARGGKAVIESLVIRKLRSIWR